MAQKTRHYPKYFNISFIISAGGPLVNAPKELFTLHRNKKRTSMLCTLHTNGSWSKLNVYRKRPDSLPADTRGAEQPTLQEEAYAHTEREFYSLPEK